MATSPNPASRALIRCGSFFFKYRNMVFPAFLVVAVLAIRPEYWLSESWDDVLDFLGVIIALLGQSFRAFVIGLAYIKRGGLNKKVYADKLVTDGVFSACRNPLYLGNALILTGLVLILNDPIGYVLGGAFFTFAYWSIVRTEETYLLSKFGSEYAIYCQTVPRWWPSPHRLFDAARGASFNWRRVVMKDYGTLASWIASAIAIETYEEVAANLNDIASTATPYAEMMAALAISALLLRAAKKTGVLQDRS